MELLCEVAPEVPESCEETPEDASGNINLPEELRHKVYRKGLKQSG